MHSSVTKKIILLCTLISLNILHGAHSESSSPLKKSSTDTSAEVQSPEQKEVLNTEASEHKPNSTPQTNAKPSKGNHAKGTKHNRSYNNRRNQRFNNPQSGFSPQAGFFSSDTPPNNFMQNYAPQNPHFPPTHFPPFYDPSMMVYPVDVAPAAAIGYHGNPYYPQAMNPGHMYPMGIPVEMVPAMATGYAGYPEQTCYHGNHNHPFGNQVHPYYAPTMNPGHMYPMGIPVEMVPPMATGYAGQNSHLQLPPNNLVRVSENPTPSNQVTPVQDQAASELESLRVLVAAQSEELQKLAATVQGLNRNVAVSPHSVVQLPEDDELQQLYAKKVVEKDEKEKSESALYQATLSLRAEHVVGQINSEKLISGTAKKDDLLLHARLAAEERVRNDHKNARKARQAERKRKEKEEEAAKIVHEEEQKALRAQQFQEESQKISSGRKSSMKPLENVLVPKGWLKKEDKTNHAPLSKEIEPEVVAASEEIKPEVVAAAAARSLAPTEQKGRRAKAIGPKAECSSVTHPQPEKERVLKQPLLPKSTADERTFETLEDAVTFYEKAFKDNETVENGICLLEALNKSKKTDAAFELTNALLKITKNIDCEIKLLNLASACCFVGNNDDELISTIFYRMVNLEKTQKKIFFADFFHTLISKKKHPALQDCQRTDPHSGRCTHSELRRLSPYLVEVSPLVAASYELGLGGPCESESALKLYKQLYDKNPQTNYACSLATLFEQKNQPEEAVKVLDHAIETLTKTTAPQNQNEFDEWHKLSDLKHLRNLLLLRASNKNLEYAHLIEPTFIQVNNTQMSTSARSEIAIMILNVLKKINEEDVKRSEAPSAQVDETAMQKSFKILWQALFPLTWSLEKTDYIETYQALSKVIHELEVSTTENTEPQKPTVLLPDQEESVKSSQELQNILHYFYRNSEFERMQLMCEEHLKESTSAVEVLLLASYLRDISNHRDFQETTSLRVKALKMGCIKKSHETRSFSGYFKTLIKYTYASFMGKEKANSDKEKTDSDSGSKNMVDYAQALISYGRTFIGKKSDKNIQLGLQLLNALPEESPFYTSAQAQIKSYSSHTVENLENTAENCLLKTLELAETFAKLKETEKVNRIDKIHTKSSKEISKAGLAEGIAQNFHDLIPVFTLLILNQEQTLGGHPLILHNCLQRWFNFYHSNASPALENLMRKKLAQSNFHEKFLARLEREISSADNDHNLDIIAKILEHSLNLFACDMNETDINKLCEQIQERIVRLSDSKGLTKKRLESMVSLIKSRMQANPIE